MSLEIDHIIIFTQEPDRDAAALRAIGLTEGTPNTHSGQGTACCRFFFHNAYLELLYLVDEFEARSETTAPLQLPERFRGGKNICPFGIAFRFGQVRKSFPIPHWDYQPRYLPPDLHIEVATTCDRLEEPLLINLPFASRPDALAQDRKQPPMDHAAGIRELTTVQISGPWNPRSEAIQVLDRHMPVQALSETDYFIHLGFDYGGGKVLDLRPQMPLTLALGKQ